MRRNVRTQTHRNTETHTHTQVNKHQQRLSNTNTHTHTHTHLNDNKSIRRRSLPYTHTEKHSQTHTHTRTQAYRVTWHRRYTQTPQTNSVRRPINQPCLDNSLAGKLQQQSHTALLSAAWPLNPYTQCGKRMMEKDCSLFVNDLNTISPDLHTHLYVTVFKDRSERCNQLRKGERWFEDVWGCSTYVPIILQLCEW